MYAKWKRKIDHEQAPHCQSPVLQYEMDLLRLESFPVIATLLYCLSMGEQMLMQNTGAIFSKTYLLFVVAFFIFCLFTVKC
jgi:hypothetical protein